MTTTPLIVCPACQQSINVMSSDPFDPNTLRIPARAGCRLCARPQCPHCGLAMRWPAWDLATIEVDA